MFARSCCAIFALIFICAETPAAPADDFATLLDESWEWRVAQYPLLASRLGDRRYNERWTDLSIEAFEQRHEVRRDFLRRLRIIDSSALSAKDQLNYDLMRRQLQNDVDAHQFRDYLMPINQRGGVQSLDSVAEGLRLRTLQDYEDWLTRIAWVRENVIRVD